MSHYRNGPVAPGIAFITGGARGLGNAIARSFAKEGAKGVALVDIQDENTFAEGKANVEKYGAKVRILNNTIYIVLLILPVHHNPLRCNERRSSRESSKGDRRHLWTN